LYITAFGAPVIISAMMKYFGTGFMFFQTLCLYGYSMVILIPITLLCAIPMSVSVNNLFKINLKTDYSMALNYLWIL